jgi:hypothetical protein
MGLAGEAEASPPAILLQINLGLADQRFAGYRYCSMSPQRYHQLKGELQPFPVLCIQ